MKKLLLSSMFVGALFTGFLASDVSAFAATASPQGSCYGNYSNGYEIVAC